MRTFSPQKAFDSIASLYGNPTVTAILPLSSWSADLPAGVSYQTEYDDFYDANGNLVDVSEYWSMNTVPYLPINSADEKTIFVGGEKPDGFASIGIVGSDNISIIDTAFMIIMNGIKWRIIGKEFIREDWYEFRLSKV